MLVNVIAKLEFKLAYNDVALPYATETSPKAVWISQSANTLKKGMDPIILYWQLVGWTVF